MDACSVGQRGVVWGKRGDSGIELLPNLRMNRAHVRACGTSMCITLRQLIKDKVR